MITLLTDFGTSDYFVPAIKGAILSLHPSAILVDITHDIGPQDILSAAFTLSACFRDFPPHTVHLAVVDPGVGSRRRAVVVAAHNQTFVGPDNGIFSFIYRQTAAFKVYEVTRQEFFMPAMSLTFHGRDLFAPLAAHLDRGLHPEEVGPEILDFERLAIAESYRDDQSGATIGEIIHIDRFGNCITNLTRKELDSPAGDSTVCMLIGDATITRFGSHFAEAQDGLPIAYLGSAGYWEIGVWCRSAAVLLGAGKGSRVSVLSRKEFE